MSLLTILVRLSVAIFTVNLTFSPLSLDMQAIEALIHAIKHYTGGVLVVSHDEHFIKNVCNEMWLIANRTVKQFDGNFDDYKKMVLNRK